MASFCSCLMEGDGGGMVDTNSKNTSTFPVVSVILESLAECVTCTGSNAEVCLIYFSFNYPIFCPFLISYC